MKYDLQAIFGIMKRMDGLNHDLGPKGKGKLKNNGLGPRDRHLHYLHSMIQQYFTNSSRSTMNQCMKFDPILAFDLLKRMNGLDPEDGPHRNPKWQSLGFGIFLQINENLG